MKASDELYQLVRSLSKAEKRYFKLYASLQSGNKNYLRLFDALDKQVKRKKENEAYDEQELIYELEGHDFVKHLPVTKNYLYQLILKSLRSDRTDDSVEKYLKGAIMDIRFLYEKSLYQQAHKHIAKAKRTAQQHEKFLALIELISLEHDMNLELLDIEALANDTPNHFQQIKDTLSAIDNLYEYKKLEADVKVENKRYMWAGGKDAGQKYKEVMEHPLLQDESRALSEEAHLLYYLLHIVALFHAEPPTGQETIEKIYQYNTKLLQLFDQKPEMAENHTQRYMAILRNQISAANHLGYEKDIWTCVDKLKHFPVKHTKSRKRALGLGYMQELYIYVTKAAFGESAHVIQELKSQLPSIKRYLNKDHELAIYFSISQLLFGLERYDETLQWLSRIIDDVEYAETREDLRSFARLIRAITYFEMNEQTKTERALKNLHRYFMRQGELHQFEHWFLEFMRGLSQTDTNEELYVLFRMMKDKLEDLRYEPSEIRAFQYFDLHAWLSSKVANRSFAEIRQEKVTDHTSNQQNQKSAAE